MNYDCVFGNRIKCSDAEKKHSLILIKEILEQSKLAPLGRLHGAWTERRFALEPLPQRQHQTGRKGLGL